jgi:hypothetical protein
MLFKEQWCVIYPERLNWALLTAGASKNGKIGMLVISEARSSVSEMEKINSARSAALLLSKIDRPMNASLLPKNYLIASAM